MQDDRTKQKIKTLTNVAKITRTMEHASAAKMKKAVANYTATFSYLLNLQVILDALENFSETKEFLLDHAAGSKLCVILIGPEKGLIGKIKNELAKTFKNKLLELTLATPDKPIELISLNKHGLKIVEKCNATSTYHFTDFPETLSPSDVAPIAQLIYTKYLNKTYAGVYLAYLLYNSPANQVPTWVQLLPPLKKESLTKNVRPIVLTEPSHTEVLTFTIYELIEKQLYSSWLSSKACEYSARMLTMKTAADNAEDFAVSLSATYAKTRQNQITNQVSEISSNV